MDSYRNYNFVMPIEFDQWLARHAQANGISKVAAIRSILTEAMKGNGTLPDHQRNDVVALLKQALAAAQPVGAPEL